MSLQVTLGSLSTIIHLSRLLFLVNERCRLGTFTSPAPAPAPAPPLLLSSSHLTSVFSRRNISPSSALLFHPSHPTRTHTSHLCLHSHCKPATLLLSPAPPPPFVAGTKGASALSQAMLQAALRGGHSGTAQRYLL